MQKDVIEHVELSNTATAFDVHHGNKFENVIGHKKVWIDLDNSPHVPFFIPIIKELEARGIEVVLTARSAFQVPELVTLHHLNCRCVGRHYGKHTFFKIFGMVVRAAQLLPTAIKHRPDLAIAHCSRAQLLASKIARVPTLWIIDYEFSTLFPFFSVDWMVIPEVMPKDVVGFDVERILTYPGIKEDVYVPTFVPDPDIKSDLGLAGDKLIVTMRPPADEAHYYIQRSDELFNAAMEYLSEQPQVKIVMLPRNHRQSVKVRKAWSHLFDSGRIIIPPHAVDGLNLIWHSDLVISGGGTMNREAAALRVPVYSIFGGAIGSVDKYLADTGRLILLGSTSDVRSKIRLVRRNTAGNPEQGERPALKVILNNIVKVLESQSN